MEKRYQSMDILRAVAIITVFVAHTVLSYGAPAILAPLQFGGTGVDLFFVLSGWLLGSQLFKELVSSSALNVKRFWLRRWFRTLPAYYAVLLASGFQRYLNQVEPVIPWEYLFFVQNYQYPLEFFTVSWSLCVEEQFYLFVAPFLLILVQVKPYIIRTLIIVALLFIPSIFRYCGWFGSPEETHVRLDGCLVGLLLAAIKYQHAAVWAGLTRIAPWIAAGALFLYLFSFYNRWYPSELVGVGDPGKLLLSLMFGSWVVLANAPIGWVVRLNVPGAQYIAERAYAIYLLHPEALALMKRFFSDTPFYFYITLAFIISLLIAEVLYRVIERPFMNMRENLAMTK